MREVNLVPVASAHVLLDDVGHANYELTILLRRQTHAITQFYCERTLTRRPLSCQTVAVAECSNEHGESASLNLWVGEDEQVVEATKFRKIIEQTRLNQKPRFRALKIDQNVAVELTLPGTCLLYTSPSPRDVEESRMPSSA